MLVHTKTYNLDILGLEIVHLNLDYKGFEQYLENKLFDQRFNTVDYRFRFPNGYGARVTKYPTDNDFWEVAVMKYVDEHTSYMDYSTSITNRIYGGTIIDLNDREVRLILQRIQNLEEKDIQKWMMKE